MKCLSHCFVLFVSLFLLCTNDSIANLLRSRRKQMKKLSPKLYRVLKEMDLLEGLRNAPGIQNPSLLELSPGECQFKLLEQTHKDINDNCGDFLESRVKYNKCRIPKLKVTSEKIAKKCCRTCLHCSGCEGLRVPDEDEFEDDSPGLVDEKKSPMGTSEPEGEGSGSGSPSEATNERAT